MDDPAVRKLNGHAATAGAGGHEEEVHGAAAVARVLRLFFWKDPVGVAVQSYLMLFVVVQVIFEMLNHYMLASVFNSLGKAMERMDPDSFQAWLPLFALIVPRAAADLVARYCKWRVRKAWRSSMMVHLCCALLDTEAEPDAHVLYRLRFTDGTSTPENQITEDTRHFGDHLHDALFPVVGQVVGISLVSYRLFAFNRGYFLRALLGMPFSAAINFVVSASLMGHLALKQEATQAALRAFVGRIREHVESVAFFRGGPSELQRYTGAHASLVRTKMRLGLHFSLVATLTDALGAAIQIWPTWWLMNDILAGRSGVNDGLTAYYMMDGFKANALALISLPQILIHGGVSASRILQLLSEADRLRSEAARRRLSTTADVLVLERHSVLEGPVLELRDVALWTPARHGVAPQVLLQGLSLRLSAGESLLVVGETGAGKTALMAAIHGLWSTGRGHLSRCEDAAVFCVPQQPYMFQGSLRQQLLYPCLDRKVSDDALWKALEQVNLLRDLRSYRMESTCPWGDLLSLGQQQRIGIARALLAHEVRLMVLDDCTSALDTWNEQGVYAAIFERVPCYVSAGHKPALRQYHTQTLCLNPSEPHAWSLVPTAKGDARAAVGSALTRAAEQDIPAPAVLPSASDARARGVLPPADIRTLVQCGVRVAWPVVFQQSARVQVVVLVVAGCFSIYLSGYLAVYFAQTLGQRFLDLLMAKDAEGIWAFIPRNILYFPVKWVVLFSITFTMGRLTTVLTEALRLGLVQRYLSCGSAGLYLLHTAGSSENPSEQISDICGFDCEVVGQYGLFFSLNALYMLFGIVMSGFSLWKSDPLVGQVLTAFLLVVGSATFQWILRPAMQTFMVFLERSTSLRSSISHAYIHAHSVSFIRGGPAELTRIKAMTTAALDASFKYLFYVNFFKGVDYVIDSVVNSVRLWITAPRVFSGTMTFSECQALGFQMRTVSTQINDLLLSVCSAAPVFSVSSRLRAFTVAVDGVEAAAREGPEGIELREGPVLELEDVVLKTPRSALGIPSLTLLRGTSARLPAGASMLIAGESGAGKSSLLRALAGLWSNGDGVVRRPAADTTFFVSQRPYLCLGSLREQLLYPGGGAKTTTSQLCEVVKTVGLEHLLTSPGLEEEDPSAAAVPDAALNKVQAAMHWTARLSQGEVQRVSFARALLRTGLELVLLDEGTAAMDTSHEAEMYRLLGEHVRSYVSVAHRPQLRRFHTHVLVLERKAGPAVGRFLPMAEYERELGA